MRTMHAARVGSAVKPSRSTFPGRPGGDSLLSPLSAESAPCLASAVHRGQRASAHHQPNVSRITDRAIGDAVSPPTPSSK